MVSKRQLADELEEVDNYPEEVNPFGSAVRPSDRAGLDPKLRADPR